MHRLKKILQVFGWLVVVMSIISLLGMAQAKHATRKLISTDITIIPNDVHFIDNDDIVMTIIAEGITIDNSEIKDIAIQKIETLLNNQPQIRCSEVYTTMSGKLKIDVCQRKPMARVIRQDGLSYYIDMEGSVMPLSYNYTADVTVFTGNIQDPVMDWSIDSLHNDSIMKEKYMIDDIYKMSLFFEKNPFWKAQIQQVFVNEKNEMELIPIVGSYRIILGKGLALEKKFAKLTLFYEKCIETGSCNEYDTLNLKYLNQVICSKKRKLI